MKLEDLPETKKALNVVSRWIRHGCDVPIPWLLTKLIQLTGGTPCRHLDHRAAVGEGPRAVCLRCGLSIYDRGSGWVLEP